MIAKTPLEKNLLALDRASQQVVYYGQLLVGPLNNVLSVVLGLPDAEAEELLNHLGAETVQTLLSQRAAIGAALNAALDAQGDTGGRVTLDLPRAFNVGADGKIALVPLPVPEPEPKQPEQEG